jgi:2,3-bisphosphoglycerate-independent phosphoglycerate mutase
MIYAPSLEGLSLNKDIEKPGLGNVAATNFNLLGFEVPDDYMPSLLKF